LVTVYMYTVPTPIYISKVVKGAPGSSPGCQHRRSASPHKITIVLPVQSSKVQLLYVARARAQRIDESSGQHRKLLPRG
jgi:hypothetical protein